MTKNGRWAVPMFLLAAIVSTAYPSLGGPTAAPGPRGTRGWNAPVEVHREQSHRETSIALSPTDPDLMIVCSPSGVPATSNKQSYFHLSHDGGRTWEPEKVEGDATDTRNYAYEGGDCDVTFDEGGTMYSGDTWVGNLSIGHSFDKGETWQGTALAATGLIVDRPWLVGGPQGTLHVSYQDLQCCTPSTIWYTRSDDFGTTFRPTVPVADAGTDGAFTWQGNFVVSKDEQDLYLVYSRRQGPAVGSLDEQGPETLWVAASHDGGTTWQSHLIADMPNPVSYLYPSIAMDKNGSLHVVFSSRGSNDRPIWYAMSKDGEKWTKPLALSRGGAGFSPWIATDDAGNAAIVWYGSPDPKAYDSGKFDWYMYWARVTNPGTPYQKVTSGPTTTKPLFTGQSGIPEFEMVALDDHGRMHIGASVYLAKSPPGTPNPQGGWVIIYQREK